MCASFYSLPQLSKSPTTLPFDNHEFVLCILEFVSSSFCLFLFCFADHKSECITWPLFIGNSWIPYFTPCCNETVKDLCSFLTLCSVFCLASLPVVLHRRRPGECFEWKSSKGCLAHVSTSMLSFRLDYSAGCHQRTAVQFFSSFTNYEMEMDLNCCLFLSFWASHTMNQLREQKEKLYNLSFLLS